MKNKNNKKIIILLVLVLFLTTGCAKNFVNKETKKSYTANILCKPETKEIQDIYKKYDKEQKINYDKLPSCEKLKVTTGGYEGLWTNIFVKPLSWLILKLGLIVKNYGISIMIIGFLMRLLMYPLTKKSTSMNDNMQKIQPEMKALEKKYKNRDDKESQMLKSQEMMQIYKKNNVSPVSGCLFSFLQIPIFFAFYESIQRVPVFFEETLWKFHLGTTPYEGMFKEGNYWYIIIIVLIIAATYFSFQNMNTAAIDDAQAKQMKMMNKFMIIFISFVSFTLPTALALYWIVSNLFTVIQNLVIKKSSHKKPKEKQLKKLKAIKN
ncbi:MAG: YidC/Oxa1 family membrane protein insertase [Bacilli bacterium]